MSKETVPERLKSLEVRQGDFMTVFEKFTENTDKNFKLLTSQGSEIAVAVVQMATTNDHLEKSFTQEMVAIRKAHDKEVLAMRKEHAETQSQVDGIVGRVTQLELDKATADGYTKAKYENKSFWIANWFNIIKFIGLLSSGLGVFYYVANYVMKAQ